MVYVDEAIWPFGQMIMCHMMADTLEELHKMAKKIGVAQRHFQNPPGRVPWHKIPHYDICKSKRVLAIENGAVEIDRKKTVEIMNYWRERNRARHLIKNPHPLRVIFRLHAFGERMGMDWLQDRGHISDLAMTPEDVAPADVARVVALHNAYWARRQ